MIHRFTFSGLKNYCMGFATSGSILLLGLLYFNPVETTTEPQNFTANLNFQTDEKIELKEFNPNDLDEQGWKSMGFTERQVSTILKYKNIVGGNFNSKAQLKKCYAISKEKFAELEKFILLPETSGYLEANHYPIKNYQHYNSWKSYSKKELNIPGKFNPDDFSSADFVKMGFSENQSNAILKYKSYLGGSFISKEKFKECFIISDENFRKLAPYLLLPEKTPQSFNADNRNYKMEKTQIQYQNFDPNITDLDGWKKLGFSEKQAQVIINYRDRNLKGSFKNIEDIANCFVISAEKFQEMKPFIKLNPENFKTNTPQNTVSNSNSTQNITPPKNEYSAEAKTDFAKTDLNEITYKQLIEFGFDEKSAAGFIGFRNKLGGFVNKNQILDIYNIDVSVAQKLITTAFLKSDHVQKYGLMEAPESWLKSHPYFKYYADKIIYYRISNTNAKKIFREMKVKQEAEQKMKLYLL